jgi:cytochrome c oxidase subunit 2
MNWWFPENASSFGQEIDSLFFVILYITGAVFFIVEIGLVVFMIKYRRRAGRKAEYVEGSTKAEIIWTAIPAVAVIWLGLFSQPLWSRIKAQVPEGAIVYDVTGKQFEWHIRYPGPDGRLDTDDDLTKRNEMRVIVNRDYVLQLHAEDVIHSFFVPAFRVKQDVVPALAHNRTWFRPTRTGEFEIACAELCGLGHYRMRARVIVQTEEEFNAWQASQATPAAPPADSQPAGRASS